jgi:peptidoglycan/xylan/chitin deacetylase (PgdA/CDA1 family)
MPHKSSLRRLVPWLGACLALTVLPLSACLDEKAPPPEADLYSQAQQAASTLYPAIDFSTRPTYVANNVLGLSFDDGPDSVNTPLVLDALKAKGVKATFFINTDNYDGPVDSNTTLKNLIKRIVNEGHVLGSHTVHHLHLPDQTAAKIESEITGVQTTVNRTDVLGTAYPKITLLRDPFGEPHQGGAPGQAAYDKVAPIVGKYAVHIGWAIDPTDYDCVTGTAAQNKQCVLDNVLNTIKTPGTGDYGMILMHSVQPQTAAAIGQLIDTMKSRGFVFKTAEEFVQARFGKSSNEIVYGTGTCTPESNATFCSRMAKNCGSVTAADNCGTSRTVSSCGTCTSPQTCGGGGTANVCGGGTTCTATPFGGTARAIPGTIQAEDYDEGGQPCAYSDTTTANQGGQYRTAEGVDIQVTTDTGGGFNIGYVQAAEYLNYTVNVATAGNYKLEARVATTAAGKSIDVFMGSTLIANDLAVTNTGNYQTFATVSIPSVSLAAGTQTLKVVFNQASMNLNWLKFTALVSCTPETDAAFCTRVAKNCGTVSGTDNCGSNRNVASCGSCVDPQTCGGAGTPNVCGEACVPETDAAFCARVGKNCGAVSGTDNCGSARSTASCGTCTSPDTCGGAGVANICGTCVGESDAAFCARLGKNCGSFSGTDNCGVTRTASSCGSCTAPAMCSASNVCTSALGISNLVVNDTTPGNDAIANNTQWSVQANFGGGAGQKSFGDRTYTISALTGTATSLAGKPWIRTAADSKTYAVASPPLANALINASFVNLAVDSRHATAWLTAAGYTSRGFAIGILEGTTARTYNVWRKAITPGSTVALPSIGSATAPCYFVIVE